MACLLLIPGIPNVVTRYCLQGVCDPAVTHAAVCAAPMTAVSDRLRAASAGYIWNPCTHPPNASQRQAMTSELTSPLSSLAE
jgi:hypothetical protein